MSKRLIYLFLAVLSAGFLSCSEKSNEKQKREKPNILFIFADDQCFNTIHALGNQEVQTPTLDNLVDEGLTFTHAYNMGAWHGAVCVASRTMLNTGLSVWRAMRNEKMLKHRAAERKFWAQMMEDAGYETYFTGKWHVKIPPEKVFNHVVHERPGMPNQTPEGYNRPVEGKKDVWSPYDKKFGGYWKGGKHWSEVLGDDAVNYIQEASKKDKPFFMYLAFNAPHDPRQSPKKFVDMYPWQNIALPENFLPEYPYKDVMGCGKDLRDERLAPFPRTPYAVKVNRQEYYAIITHLDTQIARILAALDKSGKKDNTYIFFTADHGLACGQNGLMGKQNMFDHSIRPPLIVAGPDVPENKRIDQDVYMQDIMATALDLAGVPKPEYVEFNSLMPFVRGTKNESNYHAIYGGYMKLQRMIRSDGFKLILYPEGPVTLLFDLNKDPLEMHDLSKDDDYKDIREDLFGKLLEMQKELADSLDLESVYPELMCDCSEVIEEEGG